MADGPSHQPPLAESAGDLRFKATTALQLEQVLREREGIRQRCSMKDVDYRTRPRRGVVCRRKTPAPRCCCALEIGSEGRNFQFASNW